MRDLPPEIRPDGGIDYLGEPDPNFDDSSIRWAKIWTPYKLPGGEVDYAYACSPKCIHELEELYTGGGKKCSVTKSDGKISITPWEPINSHL